MTHHPPPRTRPPAAVRALVRLGRVLTGLAAAGLLAVLLLGVPYGLWHWLGWPLPRHVPTWQQTRDTLTGPFTDRLLLNTLACLCWILWAVFLTDIVSAIPDALRNTGHAHTAAASPGMNRQSGPLRGLAALLLATILAGLLSLRPPPASAARSAAPLAGPRLASSRPLHRRIGCLSRRLRRRCRPARAPPSSNPRTTASTTASGASPSDAWAMEPGGRRSTSSTKAIRKPTAARSPCPA
jgi:hypothetical protein